MAVLGRMSPLLTTSIGHALSAFVTRFGIAPRGPLIAEAVAVMDYPVFRLRRVSRHQVSYARASAIRAHALDARALALPGWIAKRHEIRE
jgi:hypothetical protein